MRLLALNIQHTGIWRAAPLAAAILGESPDVVVLSEVEPGDGAQRLLELLAEGGVATAVEGTGVSERLPYTVAIAAREPAAAVRSPFEGTRFAQSALEVVVLGVTILGLYLPLKADHHPFWDDDLLPYAERHAGSRAVLVGDWNTGSRALDIGGTPVPGMARFDALVASGWTDAWRALHPETVEYTWHHAGSGNGFRLDHALLSAALAPSLVGAEYRHDFRMSKASDHSGLVLDLA